MISKDTGKKINRQIIKRRKYVCAGQLLRGGSMSANPDYMDRGVKEAIEQLLADGIVVLDITGSDKDPLLNKEARKQIDNGDRFGRYRLVEGKKSEVEALMISLEKQEKHNLKDKKKSKNADRPIS